MKSLYVAILVLAMVTTVVQAGDLVIGADVSRSNPLVSHAPFAKAVAERLSKKVRTLEYGEWVHLKTFGDGGIQHIEDKSLQITRRMSPQQAASRVADAIRGFPSSGQGEGSTNLLGFLENNRFDCDTEGAAVWLLTDAIEQSAEVNGNDLLLGKPLPAPFAKPLDGCDVVIIGLGRIGDGGTLPRSQLHALQTTWTDWLNKAGARSVEILVNP